MKIQQYTLIDGAGNVEAIMELITKMQDKDANCIAHKPAPQAGQCAQALNTCTVGTVKDTTNIANGKRWSCQGLHG